jgi:hypothetical protein
MAGEAVFGALRMAGAATGDLAHAFDLLQVVPDGRPGDPFHARDPDYIRDTLPAMRLMSDAYFRGEVHGLEHVPAEGPVLLVGNHSGGTLIADTFVFAQAFYGYDLVTGAMQDSLHDLAAERRLPVLG